MSNEKFSANIKVLIETAKYLITGKLVIDSDTIASIDTKEENILLYILNSTKKFISLKDCVVTSKDHVEYQPEKIKYFHINMDIVQTCRIINDD
jgi:hypothetical protein